MSGNLEGLRKFLYRAVEAAQSDDPSERPTFAGNTTATGGFSPLRSMFRDTWAKQHARMAQSAAVAGAVLVSTAVVAVPYNAYAKHHALLASIENGSMLVFDGVPAPEDKSMKDAAFLAGGLTDRIGGVFISPGSELRATLRSSFGPHRCEIELPARSASPIDGSAPVALLLVEASADCYLQSQPDAVEYLRDDLKLNAAVAEQAALLITRHAIAQSSRQHIHGVSLRAVDDGGLYDELSNSRLASAQLARLVIDQLSDETLAPLSPQAAAAESLRVMRRVVTELKASTAAVSEAIFTPANSAMALLGQRYLDDVREVGSARRGIALDAVEETLFTRYRAAGKVAPGDEERGGSLPSMSVEGRSLPLRLSSGGVIWVDGKLAEEAADALGRSGRVLTTKTLAGAIAGRIDAKHRMGSDLASARTWTPSAAVHYQQGM